MKKLAILMIVVVSALVCMGAADSYNEYTITLSAATWTNVSVKHGNHVQFSTALTDLNVRIKYNIYGSGGGIVGYGYYPADIDTNYTYPAAGDTTFTIKDTSLTAWDTFNDMPVDRLRMYSTTGGTVTVRTKE